MRVLYVSKALVVAAYRQKLRELNEHVQASALIPDHWGGAQLETADDAFPVYTSRTFFSGRNHVHVYRDAVAVLDAVKPDLVHIDEEPYSAVTYQLLRMCARRGIPSLFFAWQNLHKRLPPPFGSLRSAVFRRIDGAIAGTESAAAVLRRAGYEKTLAVIPQFGVDAQRFAPDACARSDMRTRLGAASDDFVIGFAGRLVREKGVYQLVEAVRRLPNARLVLVGDGPERSALTAAVNTRNLSSRIYFAGHVHSLDMPKWLNAFDVIAVPSLGTNRWVEQFGRVIVEAMSCGVPAVGSTSGEIPNVIGDAGVIVPEGDVDALTATLADLHSAAVRGELARRARNRVLQNYTHAHIAAKTADYYRTLVPAGAAA